MAILDDVREAVAQAAYRISGHAADQLAAEDLDEVWILEATTAGALLEDFPAAFPKPCGLVAGKTALGQQVQALWSFDRATGYAVLLSIHRPEAVG